VLEALEPPEGAEKDRLSNDEVREGICFNTKKAIATIAIAVITPHTFARLIFESIFIYPYYTTEALRLTIVHGCIPELHQWSRH
jgi:hypothetical protein